MESDIMTQDEFRSEKIERVLRRLVDIIRAHDCARARARYQAWSQAWLRANAVELGASS